uniref:Uncharacterized protein n=1 Tax=Arundo donax TaxID=35708 RepID=A0A0A9HWI8_ARUDO
MAAPFVYRRSSVDDTSQAALLKAALDGHLSRIKGIIRRLGIGNGDRIAVFSFHKDGFGVMHCMACQGHLEVCKYLVEELGGDPNMAAGVVGPFEGRSLSLSSSRKSLAVIYVYLRHLAV